MKLYAPVATALGNDTTLSASLTDDATTASFTSTTLMPTAGFASIVRIDNEVILVTGGSGNPYTIERAYEGTTAAAHASGAGVNHVVTPVAVRAAASPIIELATSGTVTIDASLGDIFTARLTGNTTFAAPTNPTNGQRITLCIEQDSTPGYTITYNSAFSFNGAVPSKVPSGWDESMSLVQEFVYNSTNTRWDCISAVLHGGSLSAQILADTPGLYWKLDETSGTTAADSSGNSRNGTYTNSPTLGADGGNTQLGKATTFDGSNDYVITAASPSTWSFADTYTIEFIAKVTSTGSEKYVMSLTSQNPGVLFLSTGQLKVYWNGNTSTESSAYAAADGNWHHFAITKSGATHVLYVDGVSKAWAADANSTTSWGGNMAVGGVYSGGSLLNPFKGSLQHFALYTTALSATRIAAHYDATGLAT